MDIRKDGIRIGTVSGGIVNFGGAVIIAPISITKTVSGAGGGNEGGAVVTNTGKDTVINGTVADLLNTVRTMLG